MNEMSINKNIAALRKQAGYTQEALASKLGISYQAVSKWENGLSCPDLQLLPKIAEIFSVSIDSLFGLEAPALPQPPDGDKKISPLPWEDNGDIYIVVYRGHELISEEPAKLDKRLRDISFQWEGPALNVNSAMNLSVKGDVRGDASAGGGIACNNIEGSASAGAGIACDIIQGNATAGRGIACDSIMGSAMAGMGIVCDDMEGDFENDPDFHGIRGSFHLDTEDMTEAQREKFEKIKEKAESLETSGLDLADRIVDKVGKILDGIFK